MRIGIVTHEYPRTTPYGGVGAHLRELVPHLTAAGMKVSIFAPDNGTPIPMAGVDLTLVSLHVDRPDTENPDHEAAFRRWLRDTKPDLVHVHHLFSTSFRLPQMLQSQGVPYVLHVHDMSPFCNQSHLLRNTYPTPPLCSVDQKVLECAACMVRAYQLPTQTALDLAPRRRALGRTAIAGAAAVVYVSEAVRKLFEDDLGWRAAHSLVQFPALNWPEATPESAERDSSRPTRIVMLGHVIPIKGVDIAIEALREAGPDLKVQVDVHGSVPPVEPYHSTTMQLAASVPQVTMHGGYAPDELAGILAGADWLLCASRFEASPLVIHEAAALGIPSIGPRIGGVPEKIGDAGLIFEPADPSSLAEALNHATDPAVRQRCADALIAPPAMEDQCAQIVELYRELVDRSVASSTLAPQYSVVIQGHNHGSAVLSAVQRLIDAGWNDADELIVVNDASTDTTMDTLSVLEGDVALVNLLSRHGSVRASNEGALAARGEVIVLLDPLTAMTLPDGWRDQVAATLKTGSPTCTQVQGLAHTGTPFLAITTDAFDQAGGLEPAGRDQRAGLPPESAYRESVAELVARAQVARSSA